MGCAAEASEQLVLEPRRAGWNYLSFAVYKGILRGLNL
jgi:hypothetical protein